MRQLLERLTRSSIRRFFGKRNPRADRKEQRIESKIPDPARQHSQNVEQLAAAASTKKEPRVSGERQGSNGR